MAASNDTITITFNGHTPKFKGTGTTQHRVHSHGHLWLSDDNTPFTVIFNIATANYQFDPNGPINVGPIPDPPLADPRSKKFVPKLRSATQLQLVIQNTGSTKSYYQLNFLDPQGQSFRTTDPIIVNR